jgi:tetratricopeptide (TPR) repeat protein
VLLERQQTLRALVDWSYDLLHEKERTLFARLSVFAGGSTLPAAEKICSFEPLARDDVLDLVTSLAEKSLLQVEGGDSNDRYRMLETIRDYAREKLEGRGESLATAARHCDFYFVLAKQGRDGILGPDQAEWIDCLEADLDNVRGAIALALTEQVDPFIAVKMAVALQGFWAFRGYVGEGRAIIRATLALQKVASSDLARGWALYVGAALAGRQGDHAEACRMLETCLQLRQQLGTPLDIAATLSTLGEARLHSGDAKGAAESEREALRIFRGLGERRGEAIGLLHLAHVARYAGDGAGARIHLEQALALGRDIKDRELEGECEWMLGALALDTGDVRASYVHLERSLTVCGNAGEKHGEAIASWWLGKADLAAGNLNLARIRLTGALQVLHSFEMYAETLGCLEDHAALAHASGLPQDAVRHLAAASAARDRLAIVLQPHEEVRRQATIATIRREIGDTGFNVAWSEGHLLDIGDAVRRAVSLNPREV